MEAVLARHGLGDTPLDVSRRADSECRGLIRGIIVLPMEGLRLAISERIDMARGRDPRKEYTYHLILDMERIWGWDRDLSKPMPLRDHHHPVGGGERVAGTISLDGALTQAWETLADLS